MADDTSNTGETDSTDDSDGDVPETGAEQQQSNGQRTEVPPEVTRALKAANKEAETLRRKLKEFEDRDKTAAQLLEERAAAADRVAAEATAQLLRYQVATAKGLPAELVGRLQGATEKELAADADKLLALFGEPKSGPPKFNGGPRKTAEGKADMNALIRGGAGLT